MHQQSQILPRDKPEEDKYTPELYLLKCESEENMQGARNGKKKSQMMTSTVFLTIAWLAKEAFPCVHIDRAKSWFSQQKIS